MLYPAKVYINTADGFTVIQAIVYAKTYQYVVVGVHHKELKFKNVVSYRVHDEREFSETPTAILHVPLKSLVTAIRAILHVLTGGEVSEFTDPDGQTDVGKDVAVKFMIAREDDNPPYEIRAGSKKAADKRQKILQSVEIRAKKASCVF